MDWSEPWLLSLVAFHVLTAITILLVRHHTYVQAAILALLGLVYQDYLNFFNYCGMIRVFSIAAVLCLSTEWINEYAALNYE